MLKLFGAILILLGSYGYAVALYQELKAGIWHLRYMTGILDNFLSEISYRHLSLPESCKQTAIGCAEPYKGILQRAYQTYERDRDGEFSTCFRAEIERGLRKAPLSLEEKELMAGVFEETTIYDLDMQINVISKKRNQLEKYLRKREQEIAEKKKVYTSLGVMVGLFLILMLI